MATKGTPPADMVEDDVLNALPILELAELLEICDLIDLPVDETKKGNRREVRKSLMGYLCTPAANTDDDKWPSFLMIHSHLKLDEQQEEAGAKEDTVVKEEKKETEGAGKEPGKMKADASLVQTEPEAPSNKGVGVPPLRPTKPEPEKVDRDTRSRYTGRNESVDITRVRLKEFKLPGMIGGTGESAMSFSSLTFEIEKARKLGYREAEMCSAVISKVADKELRSYFETEADMELDEVLEMLKSSCPEPERTARSVFTKFSNDKQGSSEKPMTFITRVLRLRKKVLKLGAEEGVVYDPNMLATTAFQVIFSGLRDENIRSSLRERCKNDHTIPDKLMVKHAGEVIAAEEERKLKLFGKEPEAEVQVSAVDRRVSFTDPLPSMKKEKLNPFARIEELRAEQEKRMEDMALELNEIKRLIISNNKKGGEETADKEKDKAPKKWKPGKCPKCHEENKPRCYHCWECGKDDHKRPECPENC